MIKRRVTSPLEVPFSQRQVLNFSKLAAQQQRVNKVSLFHQVNGCIFQSPTSILTEGEDPVVPDCQTDSQNGLVVQQLLLCISTCCVSGHITTSSGDWCVYIKIQAAWAFDLLLPWHTWCDYLQMHFRPDFVDDIYVLNNPNVLMSLLLYWLGGMIFCFGFVFFPALFHRLLTSDLMMQRVCLSAALFICCKYLILCKICKSPATFNMHHSICSANMQCLGCVCYRITLTLRKQAQSMDTHTMSTPSHTCLWHSAE